MITERMIMKVLKKNGFTPERNEGFITFYIKNFPVNISVKNLPFINIHSGISFRNDVLPIGIAMNAVQMTNLESIMGKAIVAKDGQNIIYSVEAYEPTYEHFRDSFPIYMDCLTEIMNNFDKHYMQLLDRKRQMELLNAMGRNSEDTTRSHSALS